MSKKNRKKRDERMNEELGFKFGDVEPVKEKIDFRNWKKKYREETSQESQNFQSWLTEFNQQHNPKYRKNKPQEDNE